MTIFYINHRRHNIKDRNMPLIIKQKIDSLPDNLSPGNVLGYLLQEYWQEMATVTDTQVYERYRKRRYRAITYDNSRSDFDIIRSIGGNYGVSVVDHGQFYLLDFQLPLPIEEDDCELFVDGFFRVERSGKHKSYR